MQSIQDLMLWLKNPANTLIVDSLSAMLIPYSICDIRPVPALSIPLPVS